MFRFKGNACNDYTVLNERDRAQGNALLPQNGSDNNLVAGWYRFQGAAGDRMADECVVRWRCGTKHPGWLNGRHPTVDDGEVTRKVCYAGNWKTHCCGMKRQVKVKNCTGYYVYKLNWNPPLNNSRYCGNAGAGKLH